MSTSDLSSFWDLIVKSYEIILRVESNLTAIGLYVDHIEERISSFTIARMDMNIREERCFDSELKTAWLGGNINALKVVVTKVEGERSELKGLV